MSDDIGSEYKYIFNRLKKVEAALNHICRQNTQLKKANEKLRKEHDTWQQREAARERIMEQWHLTERGSSSMSNELMSLSEQSLTGPIAQTIVAEKQN